MHTDIIFIPKSSQNQHHIFNTFGNIDFSTPIPDSTTDMQDSDYGCSTSGRCIDLSVRSSKISKNTIKINLLMDNQPPDISFSGEYEYIKYSKGGFFATHVDRKRTDNHVYTVLIYPPQSIVGGELILYLFGRELIITPDKNKYVCVIFPIKIEHESRVVLEGEKIVIKGIGCTIR